jgi:hypothetical protein
MKINTPEELVATSRNVADALESAYRDGEPLRDAFAHMFIEGYMLACDRYELKRVAENAILLLHTDGKQQ